MVDKINGYTASQPRKLDSVRSEGSLRTAPTGAAGTSAAPATAASAPTQGSSLMARAERAMADAPEIDMKKVDDIKAAISRGEFSVDARAVARAFVAMELSDRPGQ